MLSTGCRARVLVAAARVGGGARGRLRNDPPGERAAADRDVQARSLGGPVAAAAARDAAGPRARQLSGHVSRTLVWRAYERRFSTVAEEPGFAPSAAASRQRSPGRPAARKARTGNVALGAARERLVQRQESSRPSSDAHEQSRPARSRAAEADAGRARAAANEAAAAARAAATERDDIAERSGRPASA